MFEAKESVVAHQLQGVSEALDSLTTDADMTKDFTADSRQMYEIWIFSILAAILIGLSGIFPLLVIPLESGPALKHGEAARKLRLMLSFAVGSLLGDVFLHLLPEVWAHMDRNNHASHLEIGLWVISGLLTFMIIEKLLGDESEFEHMQDTCEEVAIEDIQQTQKSMQELVSLKSALSLKSNSNTRLCNSKHRKKNKNKPSQFGAVEITAKLNGTKKLDNDLQKVPSQASIPKPIKGNNIKVSGYLNLMANVVDNFTHGLAVSASFCISTKVGLVTTLAILLHEIPHEVGDFAILLRSGFDRWKAAKVQFFTALGGVIGAVTTLTAESIQIAGQRTAWILPFTSGGFMYIALVTVVPDLLQEKHGWESLKQVACVCFGALSMMFVTLAFD